MKTATARTKRADEAFVILLQRLEDGSTITDACKAAGIDRGTYYKWRNTDKVEAIDNAHHLGNGSRREEAEKAVRHAFDKSWQAAAWWLERNFPNEFALAGRGSALTSDSREAIAGIIERMQAEQ